MSIIELADIEEAALIFASAFNVEDVVNNEDGAIGLDSHPTHWLTFARVNGRLSFAAFSKEHFDQSAASRSMLGTLEEKTGARLAIRWLQLPRG